METKETLANMLYNRLDAELGEMATICTLEEFQERFKDVLKDYTLIPKALTID